MPSQPATLKSFFGEPVPGPAAAPAPAPKELQTPRKPTQRRAGSKAASTPAATPQATPRKGSLPAAKKATLSPLKKMQAAKKKATKRPPKGRTAQWSLLRRAGLKSPRNAYALWSNENRRRIQRELGTADFAAVSRAVGEAWARLSEDEKLPYVLRQEEMSSVYFDAKAAYLEYAKKHTTNAPGGKRKAAGIKRKVRKVAKK